MANKESNENKKIVVCGGGLVGCLAACYFAKQDFTVDLFEMRGDIRKMEVVKGRSINMAMSVRGREGLRRIGAEESITSKGIEMHSRMLHDTKGNMSSIPYGKEGQSILSIDRRYLNELLLNEAEKYSNINIHFDHKLQRCNTNTGELKFQNNFTKETVNLSSDLIVGCDGAYSQVRQSLLRDRPVDFAQSYVSGYYLELCIPPTKDGDYAMPLNYLHIWPRGNFMLIALPNQDKSFTCTLFAPSDMFDSIQNENDLIEYFEKYFIDTIDLIGKKTLIDSYFSTKPSPLVSIKCNPHHGKKCVLFGDAAHSMVPFYGQGMNCGFEDVVVFFDLFKDFAGLDDLDTLLNKYSEIRVPDAFAICDLAVQNYTEMRYLVTTKKYKLRKYLDNYLNKILPNTWIPLYSMVTFSRIRYSEVIEKRKLQDKILDLVGLVLLSSLALGLASVIAYNYESLIDAFN